MFLFNLTPWFGHHILCSVRCTRLNLYFTRKLNVKHNHISIAVLYFSIAAHVNVGLLKVLNPTDHVNLIFRHSNVYIANRWFMSFILINFLIAVYFKVFPQRHVIMDKKQIQYIIQYINWVLLKEIIQHA